MTVGCPGWAQLQEASRAGRSEGRQGVVRSRSEGRADMGIADSELGTRDGAAGADGRRLTERRGDPAERVDAERK